MPDIANSVTLFDHITNRDSVAVIVRVYSKKLTALDNNDTPVASEMIAFEHYLTVVSSVDRGILFACQIDPFVKAR